MDTKLLQNLYKNRQSCRHFLPNKLKKAQLKKILQLALLAPSACNLQPYSFVVFLGRRAKKMAGFVSVNNSNKFATDAPCFIAIIKQPNTLRDTLKDRYLGQDYRDIDIGIMLCHLLFAAQTMGIGCCVLDSFDKQKIEDEFNIGKNSLSLLVALGISAAKCTLSKKQRKSLDIVKFLDD